MSFIINKNLTKINYTKYTNTFRAIKYIVIHYTANNGDTAYANTNYFKNIYRGASAHYFVDSTSIWQCVKDNDISWHVGAKKYYNNCRNSSSIGIELCSRKDKNGNYYFDEGTIKNAIELTKQLMKKYNIPIENVVRHYDVTRKVCPAPFVKNEEAWNNFKLQLTIPTEEEEDELMFKELVEKYGEETVKNALETLINSEINKDKASEWAIKEIEEAKQVGITDGTRPGAFATRQEVMLMTYRSQKK